MNAAAEHDDRAREELKRALVDLEHRLARGGAEEYREHLAEEAIVIVPEMALDKAGTVRAMEESEGWDRISIQDPAVRELGEGAAVITYRFSGRRAGGFAYEALMSSVYAQGEDGGWRLVLHQQTALG